MAFYVCMLKFQLISYLTVYVKLKEKGCKCNYLNIISGHPIYRNTMTVIVLSMQSNCGATHAHFLGEHLTLRFLY